MLAERKRLFTEQEYLTLERGSEIKCEYFFGEIYAMSGASENHNLIVTNIVAELRYQLKGRPCKVYSNDMRVKVNQSGLYTYPDVVALCGKALFDDKRQDNLLNPTVIVEVLSKSTEYYDRGLKFINSRKIESLQDYILVSQNRTLIEHYSRQADNKWLFYTKDSLEDSIEIPSIECTIALSEVYDKVEFIEE